MQMDAATNAAQFSAVQACCGFVGGKVKGSGEGGRYDEKRDHFLLKEGSG